MARWTTCAELPTYQSCLDPIVVYPETLETSHRACWNRPRYAFDRKLAPAIEKAHSRDRDPIRSSLWTLVPGEHQVFFVRTAAQPPAALEQTSSGLSISTASPPPWHLDHLDGLDPELVSDAEAARRVRVQTSTFFQRYPDSAHERILRTLISPRSSSTFSRGKTITEADFELDEPALASIFSATNEMFFAGRLTDRVSWDWSGSGVNTHRKYETDIIGTTAMRRRPTGGYETLIVLSSPVLRGTTSGEFSRRLLISTFLHELIHCYLFVCCGHRAREYGGHTPGFFEIASILDDWAGTGVLHLKDIEANPERFRTPPSSINSTPPDIMMPAGCGAETLCHDQHSGNGRYQHMDCRDCPRTYVSSGDGNGRPCGYIHPYGIDEFSEAWSN